MKNLTFKTFREKNISKLYNVSNLSNLEINSPLESTNSAIYQWACVTLGKLGKFVSIIEKIKIGDLTLDNAQPLLKKEGLDVIIHMDMVLFQLGIDIEEAFTE